MFDRTFLSSSESSDSEANSLQEVPESYALHNHNHAEHSRPGWSPAVFSAAVSKLRQPLRVPKNVGLNRSNELKLFTCNYPTDQHSPKKENATDELDTLELLQTESQPVCSLPKVLTDNWVSKLPIDKASLEQAKETEQQPLARSARRKLRQKQVITFQSHILQHVGDFKQVLASPVPISVECRCTIVRDRSGVSRKLWARYHLYLTQNWVFLLAAAKRPWNKTSNYMITDKLDAFDKNSQHYLGKVRADQTKSNYKIFDSGLSPVHKAATLQNTRNELASVKYVEFM